jgi:hypothetical protein
VAFPIHFHSTVALLSRRLTNNCIAGASREPTSRALVTRGRHNCLDVGALLGSWRSRIQRVGGQRLCRRQIDSFVEDLSVTSSHPGVSGGAVLRTQETRMGVKYHSMCAMQNPRSAGATVPTSGAKWQDKCISKRTTRLVPLLREKCARQTALHIFTIGCWTRERGHNLLWIWGYMSPSGP